MCAAAGIGLAPSSPDKAAAAASYPLRPAPQPPHHRCAAAHPPSRAAHPPPRRRHVLPPRPPNPPRIRWTAVFAGQARRRRRLVFPPLQSLSWTATQRTTVRAGRDGRCSGVVAIELHPMTYWPAGMTRAARSWLSPPLAGRNEHGRHACPGC
jgi:hypothetical protein